MFYLGLLLGIALGAVGATFITHKVMKDMEDYNRSKSIQAMKEYIDELEINNTHLKEQNNRLKEALHKC